MIKVFKYGALPPSEIGDIRKQMALARKYYNKLVEAENIRRTKIWDSIPQCPHDSEEKIDEKTGAKSTVYCKCDVCKAHKKLSREQYYAVPPLDIKLLRKEYATDKGLYWGSYLIVEESFAAAWKKTKWNSPIKFKSWKQGGVVGVQIQRISLPSSQFLIERADDPRIGRRRGQRHTFKLRVGSGKKRTILWSDPIKFEMHRPLQGRPVWAKICMKYSGSREVWSVNITCADVPERTDLAMNGTVAIDVGWRVMPNGGIRLAYALGDDGEGNELILGPRWRELSNRADRIRGYRDDMFDVLKIGMEQIKRLRSSASVERYLNENNLMTEDLRIWCKRERHLADYERGCRKHSVNARRNAVRVWLRNLRRKYAIAVIKNTDHKRLKDRKTAINAGINPNVRRNAHHCAPGELVEEICRVFDRKTNVIVVAGKNTSITCPVCNGNFELQIGIEVKCEKCKRVLDLDYVSTKNMLRLSNGEDVAKPTERKTTARFAKRHNAI